MSETEICVMVLNNDKFNDDGFDLVLNKDGNSKKPLMVHVDLGLDTMVSGVIPNQTTILFVMSKSGVVLKQFGFGLTHNLKNLPPEEK